MAWAKLDNPKPSSSSARVAPLAVKVKAREAPHKSSRYINIAVGYELCNRARFQQKEHRCQIMLGSGADDGKLALNVDDGAGKFIARRRKDGRYEINITQHAAAGKFSTTFPPFERPGSIQVIPGLPPVIMFEGSADFLAA